MDIGRDNGLVIDLAYEGKPPDAATALVKRVIFDLRPNTQEEEKALREAAQHANRGHGAAA